MSTKEVQNLSYSWIKESEILSHPKNDAYEPSGLWPLVLGFVFVSCMFVFGHESPWMRSTEHVQWFILCIAVSLPIVVAVIRVAQFRLPRMAISFLFLGVFGCICMDPLKYYLAGERIHGPVGFAEPSPEAFSEVGLLTSLFCLAVLVTSLIPFRRDGHPMLLDQIRGPQTTHEAAIWTSILFMIGLCPFILLGRGDNIIDTIINTVMASRSETGFMQFQSTGVASANAFCLLLANGLILCGVLAAHALLVLPRALITNGIFVSQLVLSMILIISGGGRTRSGYILMVLAAFCTLLAVQYRNKRMLGYLLVALLLTGTVWVMQYRYRYVGWSLIGEAVELPSGFSNDLASELALIVDTYPHAEPFFVGDTAIDRAVRPLPDLFLLFATSPVPRSWWPGKPIDPSWGPHNELRTGASGYESTSNVTPTVMGRAYMNYGLFGVIQVGLLMGLVCRWTDQLVAHHGHNHFALLVACSMGYYLCISIRELSPGWLYPVILLAIAGAVIDYFRRIHTLNGRKTRTNPSRKSDLTHSRVS